MLLTAFFLVMYKFFTVFSCIGLNISILFMIYLRCIYIDNAVLLKKKNLFLTVLGLRCHTQAFSSCSEQGLLSTAVHRLLIAVASCCGAYGL